MEVRLLPLIDVGYGVIYGRKRLFAPNGGNPGFYRILIGRLQFVKLRVFAIHLETPD